MIEVDGEPVVIHSPRAAIENGIGFLTENRKEQGLFLELAAQENITMICVTHEMGFARQVADRVVFMDDGQILEEGTPDHFFENPENPRCRDFLSKILH